MNDQLQLFDAIEGERRKRRGQKRAAGEDPHRARKLAWKDRLLYLVLRIAKSRALVHADDVHEALKHHGIEWPDYAHYNVLGAVWRQSIKEGWLEKTGARRKSQRPCRHADDSPVYRSLLFGVETTSKPGAKRGAAP